jgi:hypothetical protein
VFRESLVPAVLKVFLVQTVLRVFPDQKVPKVPKEFREP